MPTLRPQTGFSLIELMVAIAIMGILMAAAAPGFGNWVQNSQIRTATESVQNGLQLARAEAAKMNTAVSFTLNANNWSVDILQNTNYGIAASAVQARNGTEGTPNARITSLTNQNVVQFNGAGRVTPAPARIITFAVDNPTAGACAHLGGSVRCMNVTVDPGGKIRMCDPAILLAANPQGC